METAAATAALTGPMASAAAERTRPRVAACRWVAKAASMHCRTMSFGAELAVSSLQSQTIGGAQAAAMGSASVCSSAMSTVADLRPVFLTIDKWMAFLMARASEGSTPVVEAANRAAGFKAARAIRVALKPKRPRWRSRRALASTLATRLARTWCLVLRPPVKSAPRHRVVRRAAPASGRHLRAIFLVISGPVPTSWTFGAEIGRPRSSRPSTKNLHAAVVVSKTYASLP